MGWFEAAKQSLNRDKPTFQLNDYISVSPHVREKLEEVQGLTWSQTTVAGAACTLSFLLGFKAGRVRPSWRRITAVTDIASSDIGPKSNLLRGRALSVSDGDTIRFLHVPTFFHSSKLKDGEKLSETALAVRICTIDTPETAKFGKPGQPFGDDAKKRLENMLLEKNCKIRVLHKDQYGRIVAEIREGIWPFYKYMDEEMLKAGLAEVYRGGGAVYGFRGLEAYTKMEDEAKSSKKGMWSLQNRESAAEFKARLKKEK